jgi:hypothetical protein
MFVGCSVAPGPSPRERGGVAGVRGVTADGSDGKTPNGLGYQAKFKRKQ